MEEADCRLARVLCPGGQRRGRGGAEEGYELTASHHAGTYTPRLGAATATRSHRMVGGTILFEDLIGSAEQGEWEADAERFSRLEVDVQLDFS